MLFLKKFKKKAKKLLFFFKKRVILYKNTNKKHFYISKKRKTSWIEKDKNSPFVLDLAVDFCPMLRNVGQNRGELFFQSVDFTAKELASEIK